MWSLTTGQLINEELTVMAGGVRPLCAASVSQFGILVSEKTQSSQFLQGGGRRGMLPETRYRGKSQMTVYPCSFA